MLKYAMLLALSINTATPASALDFFIGRWAHQGHSCDTTEYDFVPIKITQNTITQYESVCALTNPVSIRGMEGFLHDAVCTGEGTEWSYRVLFLHELDGSLVYSRDGFTNTLQKCE